MKLLYKNEPPKYIFPDGDEHTEALDLWEMHTLPIGCGYFGANIYGYANEEIITLTENSFSNPYSRTEAARKLRSNAGLTLFALVNINFGDGEVQNYRRTLSLDDATVRVEYEKGGVKFVRECFASYPAHALIWRIRANKAGAVSFKLSPNVPYIKEYCNCPEDELARSGEIRRTECGFELESRLSYYGVIGYSRLEIKTVGGKLRHTGDSISVEGADEATVYLSVGTNYKMESRVFLEDNNFKKLDGYPHPKAAVDGYTLSALSKDYDTLYEEHVRDYGTLFDRVGLSFGDSKDEDTPTDVLINEAKEGKLSSHLITLLFQYGRYLLISSSRKGALPANLQGVWVGGRTSSWSAGYWHNINVQMNYWHACPANLSECFLSYSDYNDAYMPLARRHADEYIKENSPHAYTSPGTNGWIVGTGGWPYKIEGAHIGHSGPGTGAFTSLLFWDYFDFTRDIGYLREKAYPVLREMSIFFLKNLKLTDGKYLTQNSASPEQQHPDGSYHITVGCAFDQQMIYENHKRVLEASRLLGIEDEVTEAIRKQLPLLDPVLVGLDGQVKEYREEEHYSDIGEPEHRHISHLVALYPGTLINSTTPEWMNAARYTLEKRGYKSTGWAMMHRLLLHARAGSRVSCKKIIDSFLAHNVNDNLFDRHPPFQIDGNFGFTAGVCEMLFHSHEGALRLIPALPDELGCGSFRGLCARGGFTVDASFDSGVIRYLKIEKTGGDGVLQLSLESISEDIIPKDSEINGGILTKEMKQGEILILGKA